MTGRSVPNKPDVVLGLDAAWGFAPTDQTSPTLAGNAGALMDTATFTEADFVAGFYRRWNPNSLARPSVPWKVEAYSWGGLTEAPLASASWLLLAPFMMYNNRRH